MTEIGPFVVGLVALLFSIISFVISWQNQKKHKQIEYHLKSAEFHIDRNSQYEALLAECPEAFGFYGIDFKKAKKDGMTSKQLCYLILSLNALKAYCQFNQISLFDHLKRNDYRQNMFDQQVTRIGWNYVRKAFSKETREQIDKYLKERDISKS